MISTAKIRILTIVERRVKAFSSTLLLELD
jgi:hypothetical protein